MNNLKYLDISIVVMAVLILFFSKETTTSWTSVLVAGFAGMLIGSAITRMVLLAEKAERVKRGKKS